MPDSLTPLACTKALRLVRPWVLHASGNFALIGAVFTNSRTAIREAEDALRYSARNFYIIANESLDYKTTAALIGQRSFGGSRASGTNDKAGSSNPMFRFVSPRQIKEEFFPVFDYRYPSNN
ncbi:putative aldehyde dehydrogenase 4a1 [Bipolaris maydis]|nr:putative aldehyde dehydrogenase 4a1 [Bipolaris maydis]